MGCIEEAGASFATNELAYLALTSKVENPIRDRVAWAMQSRLGPDLIVSREWKRRDIGVVEASDTDTALAILEFKAGNAGETGVATKFTSWMNSDLAKRRSDDANQDLFWVGLAVSVTEQVPDSLRHVVKYRNTYKRDHKGHDFFAEMMRQHGDVSNGTLSGGRIFGLSVEVDYWVVGPVEPIPRRLKVYEEWTARPTL